MCTLTWTPAPDGYHLLFNRDERKTRQLELPPEVLQVEGRALIAPRDGDHGGTWLAVNDRGVTFALLNHYDAEADPDLAPPEAPLSRGDIPLKMAMHPELDPSAMELHRFRPFHLVRMGPGRAGRSWLWNGAVLSSSLPEEWDLAVLSTSSFDSGRAIQIRRDRYRDLGPNPTLEALEKFHRSSSPLGSAYGVLMRRDDAQTMSITHVHVGPREVVVSYEPQPREGHGGGETTVTRMPRSAV